MLRSHFSYCCSFSCCKDLLSQYDADEENTSQNVNDRTTAATGMRVTVPNSFMNLKSPQLWIVVILMVLAISIIIKNIMKPRRTSMKISLLRELSSGPFSSTKISSDGSILPTVVYSTKSAKMNSKLVKASLGEGELTRSEDILSVLDLLEDNTDADKKIIAETETCMPRDGKEEVKTSTGPTLERRSLTPGSPSNIFSTPLSPAYQSTRRVSRVWTRNQGVEMLYMYSNFDRLVYPPGYVVEDVE